MTALIALAVAALVQSAPPKTYPYIECMQSTAQRLEPSGETAATIADVAESECLRFFRATSDEFYSDFLGSPDFKGSKADTPQMRPMIKEMTDKQIKQAGRTIVLQAVTEIRAAEK